MKILLTADPEIPVPPTGYGGIERIVYALTKEYVEEGHDVTLCANPGSSVSCRLVKWPGLHSRNRIDTIRNAGLLSKLVITNQFDIVHSFSRLAYMAAIFPSSFPKIMSYQREPTLRQVKKAVMLAKRDSLFFTGCSNYISDKIATVAEAYTVYNCVPVNEYTAVPAVSEDAPLIFLGRIEEIKGTHIAVQVAVRTNRSLIIAGNIPEGHEQYFEKYILPYLSEKIVYIGPVNDKEKNDLLGKSLGLLMPVCWNEPFGIVMAEAMACGTPVLGFNRGSVPEVIAHGINGFISRNEDEMVDQVNKLLGINREEVRRIAEERFSVKKISSDYMVLYKKLIGRRNGAVNKKPVTQ